jgi:hypothetical protein
MPPHTLSGVARGCDTNCLHAVRMGRRDPVLYVSAAAARAPKNFPEENPLGRGLRGWHRGIFEDKYQE